jgi:carbon starvation protein
VSAIVLLVVGLSAFLTGYHVYSRYIARRIYQLDPDFVTPSRQFEDGVDFVPTNKHVLFGHHFTSVAGAAPIVGPAIAVIWGWLPAFLWVVLGTVFAGAVHDFGTLWISTRHKGNSIGTLTQSIIGDRARVLFLLLIFFLLLMVNAVFAVIIANLFMSNPGAVLPVWGSLVVALVVGLLIYRTGAGILLPSIAALLILYTLIWFGQYVPFELPDLIDLQPTAGQLTAAGGDSAAAAEAAAADGRRVGWIVILFVYTFFASVLPVWLLLQPRDYVNGHQLFVALGIIGAGVLITNPQVVAPAVNTNLPADAPNWFPLLFITIACGAISGFHGLVGSGTSSKQLSKETDARYIGYGGALGEGTLALTSILATTAGFALFVGIDGWHAHYGTWASASAGATTAFVNGRDQLCRHHAGHEHTAPALHHRRARSGVRGPAGSEPVDRHDDRRGELLDSRARSGPRSGWHASVAAVRNDEPATGRSQLAHPHALPVPTQAHDLGDRGADELPALHDHLRDGPQPAALPHGERDAIARGRRGDLRARAVAHLRSGRRRATGARDASRGHACQT